MTSVSIQYISEAMKQYEKYQLSFLIGFVISSAVSMQERTGRVCRDEGERRGEKSPRKGKKEKGLPSSKDALPP